MSRLGGVARRLVLGASMAAVLAGCGSVLGSPPVPGAEPFPGITGHLGRYGVDVLSWTSGDAGCENATLTPTAIRFQAQGLDQPTPLTLRIYIFRDHDAWDRRLADVDTCVASWATDPATFQIIQTSPYVLAGQGPWPPGFAQAIRQGLTEAAGNGNGAPIDQ
ncbi:MAG TPA: hypothetical protein VE011_02850 [Candidatus Dormibacteraeota bacterium]|nr:hypothetical protein [Candidatus Dormibacteraeota bacterium]